MENVAAQKRKLDLTGASSMSDNSSMIDYDESLRLTLSPPGRRFSEDQLLPVGPAYLQATPTPDSEPERAKPRRRQTSGRSGAKVKEEFIPPPYAWATDKRAVVLSLERMTRSGIINIEGEVLCKRCNGSQMAKINVSGAFLQLDNFFRTNQHSLHDRAPKIWMVPRLLDCTMCHQSDCVKPVISESKRNINWLFLMLTQSLGLCTLDQLKYFCKHTHKHRTGAKDRVLYLTYVGILEQLNPLERYE